MLRVREMPFRVRSGTEPASPPAPMRGLRLAALTVLGTALGAAGAILSVSLVQADDDAGIRAFHREEAQRRAQARVERAAYSSASASAYAPARNSWQLPLWRNQPDGRIAHPPVELNPFKRREARGGSSPTAAATAPRIAASAGGQTFCVRMCDGFHAPIGYLQRSADLPAHEALCKAMNPGIPVKVFRLPAGATSIDAAVSPEGRTYGSLPIAFGHEKASDPSCRPQIVAAGERRVSLLRDITLRAGDSVVLDGRVRTFQGSSSWPYREADFQDFRRATTLSRSSRQAIDAKLGISQAEASMRSLRRQMRVREATLRDGPSTGLRGALEPMQPAAVGPRVIMSSPYGQDD